MYLLTECFSRMFRQVFILPVSLQPAPQTYYKLLPLLAGLICAWTFCDSGPCANSGRCHNVNGGFTCSCPAMYGGRLCDVFLPACHFNFCSNHGSCQFKTDGSKFCMCDSRYSGKAAPTGEQASHRRRCQLFLLFKCLSQVMVN